MLLAVIHLLLSVLVSAETGFSIWQLSEFYSFRDGWSCQCSLGKRLTRFVFFVGVSHHSTSQQGRSATAPLQLYLLLFEAQIVALTIWALLDLLHLQGLPFLRAPTCCKAILRSSFGWCRRDLACCQWIPIHTFYLRNLETDGMVQMQSGKPLCRRWMCVGTATPINAKGLFMYSKLMPCCIQLKLSFFSPKHSYHNCIFGGKVRFLLLLIF